MATAKRDYYEVLGVDRNADENDIKPREVSFKGAKQALTAFAPKIEAARPEGRAALIDAMITTIAYHRVRNRPGRCF